MNIVRVRGDLKSSINNDEVKKEKIIKESDILSGWTLLASAETRAPAGKYGASYRAKIRKENEYNFGPRYFWAIQSELKWLFVADIL